MANIAFGDRIRVVTATTGTGTVTLGAALNYSTCTFAEGGILNGETVTYLIEEGLDFEIGRGVYTSAGTTLTRATVFLSKISGTAGVNKMNLAGTAKVSVVDSALDLLLLSADKGVDLLPYYVSATESGTTPMRPGGKALLGLVGTAGKYPYFTGNTSAGVALGSLTPSGQSLAAAVGQQAKWNVPYLTSNTSAAASVAAAKPSGLGLLALAGTTGVWQFPYLTSNTATAPSLSPVRPGGLGLLALTNPAAKWNYPYFTTNNAVSLGPLTPSGMGLAQTLGLSGKWNIPYLVSNTAVAPSLAPIQPGGLALLNLAGVADRVPYFTGNTSAGVSLATLTSYARSILDDADEATFKATVNLEIGVDVQAYNSNLTTWAGVSEANYYTITESDNAYQPKAANLTTWAGVSNTSYYTKTQSDAVYQPKDAELTALATATAASGKAPYFTGTTTASTTALTPSGMGLMATVGQASKWNVPYLISNTSAAASLAALTPSGIGLLAAANPAAKWNIPYFASNTSAAASLVALRPGGQALLGLVGAADALPYFSSNAVVTTTTLTSYARGILDDANEATFKATVNLEIGVDVQAYSANLGTWAGISNTSYYTKTQSDAKYATGSNQLTALNSVAGSIGKVFYYTAATTGATATIKPAGMALLQMTNPLAKWQVPYLTSNTATDVLAAPIKPSGMALLQMANPALKWNVPYFTSNTTTDVLTAPVKPGGMALLNLVGAADALPYFSGNTATEATTTTLTSFARSILDDADEATFKATVNLEIGTDVQAYDAELAALAGLTSAANKVPYFTGAGTAAVTDLSSYARTNLINQAAEANFKQSVNLEIGVDVQAYDAELAALAGLTSAADRVPYFTGSGTASLAVFSSFGRSLVDDADAATALTTLGALGAATADQTITGGARVTVLSLGNLSGQTYTPDPGDRPMQKVTNNGSGTIMPGSNYGNYLLLVVNTTGAVIPTTSSWTAVKGDAFDATTTSKFLCHCCVTSDFSVMTILKVA